MMLVVAALGASVFLGNPAQSESQTTPNLTSPGTVRLFGLVSTVGQGTSMVALNFIDIKTGTIFTAPVTKGSFSIDLPNGATYDVVARWEGNYSWQTGTIDRGDLTVNMSAGSMGAMSYNLQAETPPTVVAVHGTITWSLSSAQPTSIVYTASDGETFAAAVQNSTFSTRLPNLMDYQVKVYWQYTDGTTDYLFAPNQTVNESTGVVGLDLSISG